jgi:hypothetical protein
LRGAVTILSHNTNFLPEQVLVICDGTYALNQEVLSANIVSRCNMDPLLFIVQKGLLCGGLKYFPSAICRVRNGELIFLTAAIHRM